MWLGIVLYAVETLLHLALGQLNGDEGWYLYGSTLVLQGLLPDRDFAYTQMPLLPYVYGAVQGVSPSLLVGRLTSVVISLGAVGMSVVMAKRYAGAWAEIKSAQRSLVRGVLVAVAFVLLLQEGTQHLDFAPLARALDEQYRLELTLQRFGQFESAAKIYLSR